MVRPRRLRRVSFEPDVTFFKPVGIRMKELDEVVVSVDEFEAVRLKDLESLEQGDAAKKMNISQPTFHRLLLSARKKIAEAIVKGKAIKIEGGNFKASFSGSFCVCISCKHKEPKIKGIPCSSKVCPECNSVMVRG